MTDPQPNARRLPRPVFTPRFGAGLFARGFLMGAADVVPGVSGGTIAFITGIYEYFINALRSISPAFLAPLFRGRVGEAWTEFKAMHWPVLIPVLAGIAVAIVSLSKLITGMMVDHPAPTYALFFGLILASAWIPLTRVHRRNLAGFVMLAAAAVGAWTVVGLQPDGIALSVARHDDGATAVIYPGKLRHPNDLHAVVAQREAAAPNAEAIVYDEKGVLEGLTGEKTPRLRIFTDKAALVAWVDQNPALVVLEEQRAPLWWIFLCGVIAISAMVLPGLSGSFLLLFLGQYHAVFTALHQTVGHILGFLGRPMDPLSGLTAHTWTADVFFFTVFLLGVALGMLAFSRVVGWLFERAHDLTMMALTGLMIGALRLPGEVVLEETAGGRASWGVVIGVALAAGVVVLVLDRVDRRRNAAPAE